MQHYHPWSATVITFRNRFRKPQHLLLINLTVCLLGRNLVGLFIDICVNVADISIPTGSYWKMALYCAKTFLLPTFYYYILSLFYITCDRLMAIIDANIACYRDVWSIINAKILLVSTASLWFGTWFIVVNTVCFIYHWDMHKIEDSYDFVIQSYIITSFYLIFIIFAAVSGLLLAFDVWAMHLIHLLL